MGLFDKIIKGFRSTSKSTTKTATKSAIKPTTIRTTPKTYTELGSTNSLKQSAKEIAGSKIVKTTGKVGAGAVIIGGGAYGLGTLSGKGLENVGYGWRGLTNNYTPEDIRNQQLNNMEKENSIYQDQLNTLKDYSEFLKSQGSTDTPSMRDIYNRYVSGEDNATPEEKQSSASPIIIIGALAAVGAGIYLLTKKKKK